MACALAQQRLMFTPAFRAAACSQVSALSVLCRVSSCRFSATPAVRAVKTFGVETFDEWLNDLSTRCPETHKGLHGLHCTMQEYDELCDKHEISKPRESLGMVKRAAHRVGLRLDSEAPDHPQNNYKLPDQSPSNAIHPASPHGADRCVKA
eukprot:GHVT01021143.1.p1 GENE.GHVT01021143.1~~GHVT01021143.1.p1  ORF type:complete len:151 (+),score=20.12 GHVT01021143.1:579-1031(+)